MIRLLFSSCAQASVKVPSYADIGALKFFTTHTMDGHPAKMD